MFARSRQDSSFRNRILTTLPALALLAAMTACGPKPTAPPPTPPPAGGPSEAQASPGLAQSPAADPQAPASGDASPVAQGSPSAPPETAAPIDPALVERWKDVDAKSIVAQATKAMQDRSKEGVALFRSGKKDHKVQFGTMEVLGIEPDSSQRLGATIEFDGKEVPGQIVATRDGEKISFDAVAVDFPEGRVTFLWNEADSAWMAAEAPPNPAP